MSKMYCPAGGILVVWCVCHTIRGILCGVSFVPAAMVAGSTAGRSRTPRCCGCVMHAPVPWSARPSGDSSAHGCDFEWSVASTINFSHWSHTPVFHHHLDMEEASGDRDQWMRVRTLVCDVVNRFGKLKMCEENNKMNNAMHACSSRQTRTHLNEESWWRGAKRKTQRTLAPLSRRQPLPVEPRISR